MYSSKVLMNELSCRKVSDLASAEAGLGAIAAPMAPRPASLRNPRRDVTSILRTPLAPPGQHLVDHRRGGAHVIGGIGNARNLSGPRGPATAGVSKSTSSRGRSVSIAMRQAS